MAESTASPNNKTMMSPDRGPVGVSLAQISESITKKEVALDSRHYYIIERIMQILDLDKDSVEKMLRVEAKVRAMDLFFQANGSRKLLFFYQMEDENKIDESSLPGGAWQKNARKALKMARPPQLTLLVTDGYLTTAEGIVIAFLRLPSSNGVEITEQSINREVFFTVLDATEGLLSVAQQLVGLVFLPALESLSQGWGQLAQTQYEHVRVAFLQRLEDFKSLLKAAEECLKEKEDLLPCNISEVKEIQSPADFLKVAQNPETVKEVEACTKEWIKQIELIIVKSEQIRCEPDDVGPIHELLYWKKRMTKFCSLTDQLKAPEVRNTLGVLQAAKSKLIQVPLANALDLSLGVCPAGGCQKSHLSFLKPQDLSLSFESLLLCLNRSAVLAQLMWSAMSTQLMWSATSTQLMWSAMLAQLMWSATSAQLMWMQI